MHDVVIVITVHVSKYVTLNFSRSEPDGNRTSISDWRVCTVYMLKTEIPGSWRDRHYSPSTSNNAPPAVHISLKHGSAKDTFAGDMTNPTSLKVFSHMDWYVMQVTRLSFKRIYIQLRCWEMTYQSVRRRMPVTRSFVERETLVFSAYIHCTRIDAATLFARNLQRWIHSCPFIRKATSNCAAGGCTTARNHPMMSTFRF